ncbi:class I SAM-dependent methyltransferase [Spiractinospora alimapuensis]|uniref:class I SAM-dependent methyltransferase n=1 Tax=Spiractinospora alimapuensis TaxID=2820884 RepID=UPI001F38D1A0|nr:class I SAM-dependent methyltransferase [Spiractinospora alimapuensis]QVQ50306.1 class I SAM-dependent methyltransferase [Spiractinospora alimapuensis]
MSREIVNTHQYQAWNGYEGQHWANNNDRYDAMVGGMNRALFGAADIRSADHVLDIGCGAGLTTRRAATLAPEGHAHGVDLSAPMLVRAREVAEEKLIANVSFEQGDAQVHPFPLASYDVVISRGGVWYFSDSVAAFTNIASALRAGGRLAIMTPSTEEPETGGFPDLLRIMREFVPDTPTLAVEEDTTGTDTLSTPEGVSNVLTAAGFVDVRSESAPVTQFLGRDAEEAATFMFEMGPIRHWFGDVDEEAEGAARAAVVRALEEHVDVRRGVRQPTPSLVTTARKPG